MKYHPIIKAAAKAAKTSSANIIASRKKEPTAWRQVAMYLMRDTGMTFAEIGAATKRDTSTIHSTCEKLNKLSKQQWFTDMLRALEDDSIKIHSVHAKRKAIDDIYFAAPQRLLMEAFAMAD